MNKLTKLKNESTQRSLARIETRIKKLALDVTKDITYLWEDIKCTDFGDPEISGIVAAIRRDGLLHSRPTDLERFIRLDVVQLATGLCEGNAQSKRVSTFLKNQTSKLFYPLRDASCDSDSIIVSLRESFQEGLDYGEGAFVDFPGYHLCLLVASLADNEYILEEYQRLTNDVRSTLDPNSKDECPAWVTLQTIYSIEFSVIAELQADFMKYRMLSKQHLIRRA